MPIEEIGDRVCGVLLGLAAGDRNGGPIRMAVRLAESLAELRQFDSQDILSRYLGWWRAGAFDTGPTTAQVLALIDSGVSRSEAVARVNETSGGMTAGCNPAHRCPPLAMAAFLGDSDLAGCALRESGLTHHAFLAGDVAATVVTLCRALVRNLPWPRALEVTKEGRSAETIEALGSGRCRPLNPGGFAPEVLRAAIHFVGSHDSFETSLCAAIQFAGPSNYCPVLVGAFAGARWGDSAIPLSLLGHCDLLPRVCEAANKLAAFWEGDG
jgi:ADP-ribosylglycohydrolase